MTPIRLWTSLRLRAVRDPESNPVPVAETAAAESSGQVAITVLRSGPATTPASVDYSVQNGTAQAGTDFTATSGTLNFAAGQTSQTFTVPLAVGDDFDGTRSAELVLSSPQGASLGYPTAVLDLTANPRANSPGNGANFRVNAPLKISNCNTNGDNHELRARPRRPRRSRASRR